MLVSSLWDGPPPPSGTGRIPVVRLVHQRGSGAMRMVMLGIDLGKNVCSLAGLDQAGAVVLRRRLRRECYASPRSWKYARWRWRRAAGRIISAGGSPSKGIARG